MSGRLQRSVGQRLTRQLCVRLDPETRRLLDEMARRMGFRDTSKMVRYFLLSKIREVLGVTGRP